MQHCKRQEEQHFYRQLDARLEVCDTMVQVICQEWEAEACCNLDTAITSALLRDVLSLYIKLIKFNALVTHDRQDQQSRLLNTREQKNQDIIDRLQRMDNELQKMYGAYCKAVILPEAQRKLIENEKRVVKEELMLIEKLKIILDESDKHALPITADNISIIEKDERLQAEEQTLSAKMESLPLDDTTFLQRMGQIESYLNCSLGLIEYIIQIYKTLIDPKDFSHSTPYYEAKCQMFRDCLDETLRQYEQSEDGREALSAMEVEARLNNHDLPLTSSDWHDYLAKLRTQLPASVKNIYLANYHDSAQLVYHLRHNKHVTQGSLAILIDRMAKIRRVEELIAACRQAEEEAGRLAPQPAGSAFTHPKLIQRTCATNQRHWPSIHATIFEHFVHKTLGQRTRVKYLWFAVYRVMTELELLEEDCSMRDFSDLMQLWYPTLVEAQQCTEKALQSYGTDTFRRTHWAQWSRDFILKHSNEKQNPDALCELKDCCERLAARLLDVCL